VKEHSGGLPVVFLDSYQKPSKYYFYQQTPSFGLNTAYYRRNNFNFWPMEDSLIGKRTYVVARKNDMFQDAFRHIHLSTKYGAAVVENYYSFSKVQLRNPEAVKKTADEYEFRFDVYASEFQQQFFDRNPYDTARVYIAVIKENFHPELIPTNLKLSDLKGNTAVSTVLKHAFPSGKHNLRLCISTAIPGYPSLNSTIFRLEN
jgi:hypothetical protein